MLRVLFDGAPEGVICRDHVLVHDSIFAEGWDFIIPLLPVGASRQLQLQPLRHHSKLPRPNHSTVIRVRGPISRVDRVGAVGRVGDEHADRGHQPGREGAADVVGGLVDEVRKLMIICGVEEEQAETVVCVHDFDFALVVVAL